MIRILLAEDHLLVRDSLVRLLERQDDFQIVGEATTGPETVAVANGTEVDIVLLDVEMPGRGGLETLEELKRSKSSPKVVMLTARAEDEYAVRCMKAGADGYVTKDRAIEDLHQAVRKVAGGGKFFSAELAERIAMSFDPGSDQPAHARLSNRELEIMCRIARGERLSEIAEALSLSPKTISSYRRQILTKTGLRNTNDLMRYAHEQRLVT